MRLLIDDVDARDKDDTFAVADLHPNIEVRIFNPFYSRSGLLGLLSEVVLRGSRLNRRMHNKAWIADNRVAIIGGRNIGDEYFGASTAFELQRPRRGHGRPDRHRPEPRVRRVLEQS